MCACTTGAAVLMAWWGSNTVVWIRDPVAFFGYWGLFTLFLSVSLFIVVLDIRYIRLQFLLGQRELLRQTLEDETFRRALLDARQSGENGRQED
ncbi:MAG: hypothetical protein NTU83_06240 [Candidatus Hydrogenedentes bacterium]|nr:hypothetical protein [Candidatus Hydrogenedentota bacterium]